MMNVVLLLTSLVLPDTAAEFADRVREITSLSPTGQVASLSQFVLRRDAAEITFASGTMYLLSPVGGRTVGAIFRGAARVTLSPPHAVERDALERAFGSPVLEDSLSEVFLLFSDSTWDQLRKLTFTAGTVPGDLASAVRGYLGELRGDGNRVNADVLASLLNDEPDGFFSAQLRRVKGSPLLLTYDPALVESVQLSRPSGGLVRESEWTLVTQFAPARRLPGSDGMWRLRNRVAAPRYELEVWLKSTPGANLDFSGRATFWLRAQEAAGPWLRFGLDPELQIDSGSWSDGGTLRTSKVKDDGELWVRAPRRLAPGDSVRLTLFYHGDLIDRYSDFFFIDPGANWFPRNRQGSDESTFETTYHSPSWYPIASIGTLEDSTVNGRVMTTRWVTKRPTSFARFNLGLFENFHAQYEGAPVIDVLMSEEAHRTMRDALNERGYMMPAQRNMSQVVAADVSNSLKWFTHAFGTPLEQHFFVTEIPYLEGVSFPGLIDLSWSTFQNTAQDGFDEFFRAHEVAHQWWGNGVRPASYRDVWLSEGVSTFCGIWYLQSTRKRNKEYFQFLDMYSQNIRDNRNAGPTWLGYRVIPRNRGHEYQVLIYEKGAWIVHMLRMLMLDLNTGKDDRFSAMMRDFHDTYAGRAATTDDFRAIAEKHIGVPLGWFFDQWVMDTDVPTYHVAWKTEPTADGRQQVRLRVTQEGVPADFQAWVLVSADLGQNRFANFRIKVSGAQTEYTSPVLPAPPKSVTFNDLHSVLAEVKNERW
jgi:hypothetical protein